MRKTALLALALAAALASGAVLAHGRVHFGIGIGVPIWWGYPYYYPPYYYEPRTIVVPAQPQRYIEQSSPDSGYWYYCAESRTYYPYVKDCLGGWQRVSPTPR